MNVNTKKNWDFSASSATSTVSQLNRQKDKPTPPSVFYTQEAFAAIRYLVDNCTKEVGWLGEVQTFDNAYLVTRIHVPTQVVTSTETDILPEDMAALYMELMDQGVDTSTLIYWGHSHVNMGVTPSGQDETQIGNFLDSCNVFIREITNKKGDKKVDVFDVNQGYVFQCVRAEVYYEIPTDVKEYLDMAITSRVKERTYVSYSNVTQHRAGGYRGAGFDSTGASLPAVPNTKYVRSAGLNLDSVKSYDAMQDLYIFANGDALFGKFFTSSECAYMDTKLGLADFGLDQATIWDAVHGTTG
jgi:hypothetical protein